MLSEERLAPVKLHERGSGCNVVIMIESNHKHSQVSVTKRVLKFHIFRKSNPRVQSLLVALLRER